MSPSGTESGGYTNWTIAAKTIQKAVDACVNGDVVWVTNGIYYVTSRVLVEKGVTVVSVNGATTTTVDGSGVTRGFRLSHSNAVVEGFCVRNCKATVDAPINEHGGGVLVLTNGLLRNCIITNNVANSGGGGVFLYRGGILRNCLIVGNTSVGVGGYWGGGIWISDAGNVENCTVVQNQQVTLGSGIWIDHGGFVVNSIISQNTGSDNVGFTSGGGVMSYSCFTPYIAGTGNITNDPLFVNAPAGNYRLSAGSPCLDKGTNLAWMAGATDLDGNPRIANGTVDMGAYEYGFYIGIRLSAVDVIWNSAAGVTYQVQSCTNLGNPVWTNVGSSVTATGTSCYVPDWIRDFRDKFYKVLQLP